MIPIFLPRRPPVRRALICLVAVLLQACTKNLDMPRIKASIKEGIEKQAGVRVLWVDCPASRKARSGDRFECRAGVEGGAVTLDLVQDEYANAQWTQREQLLDLRKVEETVREGLKRNVRMSATVRCPGTLVPAVPGTRFTCEGTATAPARTFEVSVLIRDTRGQLDWSVPKSVVDGGKS